MKGKVLTSWNLIFIVATVLLVSGGALNLLQRSNHALPPTDGILWVQKADGIYAEHVEPGYAGSRAGISRGNKLIAISLDGEQKDEITTITDIPMYLDAAGVGGSLTYYYQKPSYKFADNYYISDLRNLDTLPRWTPSILFLSVVGLVWLLVGMFVLFKQGSRSPFVLHFATLCLAAFVFHVYKPIGTGQDFDLAVSILDEAAFVFFVALFLHFCLRYPTRSEVLDANPWKTYVLYLPAAVVTVLNVLFYLGPLIPIAAVGSAIISIYGAYNVGPLLNQAMFTHFVAGIAVGAGILIWRFVRRNQPMIRQRLKWAMWGTIVAVLPIIGLQIARYFIYLPDDTVTSAVTILPLALIPFSFGHSVVRYRLMDVDIVVRRALVYAMTTVAIALMIGTVALLLVYLAIGGSLSATEITLRALIALIAMAGIVMLSEPLKNFLQERADRFFYGERYDMRQGLLDFGRTLSATTSMTPLLNSLTEKLHQVLNVQKMAIFIEDQNNGSYKIVRSVGLDNEFSVPNDFRQLVRNHAANRSILRADELESSEIETSDDQTTASPTIIRKELHYFVPCVVRGKMVAVIGLGRAVDGSLLSSEDLDILQTLSGYIAVAIENARLYSEQKNHNEELSLLKEFNESIVESINVGLLAVDENGFIVSCNSTFEKMIGISRDEAVGRQVENVFDENFADALSNILGRSQWHLTEIRNAYKLVTADRSGNPLTLNVAVAPRRSSSNAELGAIIVIEDVTSRVKLEESVQQSEKLSSIGLLAAGVAHEVNTPLTGVSSYTQMLLGMIPETDPKHELLKKMQRQTERATNIVGNLLNFSRTGTASESIETDINKLLDDTLQLLEPQLRSSNIEIVKDYASSLPFVLANGGKLQQVFTNLILNARDAMIGGGKITLKTENAGDEISIEVADTGSGISEENINKIFDPFFTTKEVGSGTGLGLAVSYGIVQEHFGTINAANSPGGGAVFRLTFPVASQAEKLAVS